LNQRIFKDCKNPAMKISFFPVQMTLKPGYLSNVPKKKLEEMTPAHAEVVRNIKNAVAHDDTLGYNIALHDNQYNSGVVH